MSEIDKSTQKTASDTEKLGQSAGNVVAGATSIYLIEHGLETGDQKEVGLGLATGSAAVAASSTGIVAAIGTVAGGAAAAAASPLILPVAAIGGAIGLGMMIFGKRD